MSLIPDVLIIVIVTLLAGGAGTFFWLRRRPKVIKTDYFQREWRAMQKLCGSKETWPQAIVAADDLLDEILKKKRFAGKSMGERLTHAQRLLTNNETVWFGHKLRARIDDDPKAKLKESDVKQALMGIRQAMKDLGAFSPDAAKSEVTPAPVAPPAPAPKKKLSAKPTAPSKVAKSAKPLRPVKKESKK
jgi:hypothetical protein